MIPARGGSKEIPGKNIRLVAGKPLIAWTIEAAAASRYVDRVIVSTDDRLIAETAEGCGAEVPFLRPAELASDDAPIEAPALHAIENLPGYDYLATLQPTTPLRGAETLDACIAYALDRNASACASMTEPAHKPYWMYRIREDRTIEPLMKDKYPSRQLFPKYHTLNGAIYLAQTDWLKKTRSFCTPETIAFLMSQLESIDIDNELELEIAEYFLRKRELRKE